MMTRHGGVAIAAAVVAASLGTMLFAQTAGTPHFEVASVRKTISKEAGIFVRWEGLTYTAKNITVRELIQHSYSGIYSASEIIGGPSWIDSDRFEIVAKAEKADAPFLTMARTLLSDRFNLRTHQEMRDLPVYRLVLANPDKELGSGLRHSNLDCKVAHCGFRPGSGSVVGTGVPLGILTGTLGSATQRRVVDKTGLVGSYDFNLTWAIEGMSPGASIPATASQDAPSIFTAVREQLGLKLEAATEGTPVLIIDSVEHPTEN